MSDEKQTCLVCQMRYPLTDLAKDKRLVAYDTKRLIESNLCPEHAHIFSQDFLALVGCVVDETPDQNRLMAHEAKTTGQFVHIKRTTFNQVFNTEVPLGTPLVYVGQDTIDQIKEKWSEADKAKHLLN